jgi:hypothetical protein
MPRSAHAVPLVLALAGLIGASCRSTPTQCEHENTERCLWEAGVSPPPSPDDPDPAAGGEDGEGGVASETTELDQTLAQMVSIIGAGLEWSLVDERARALCSGEPRDPEPDPERPTAAPDAWTCAIAGLEINDQPLSLEATDGVLSLSAVDIGEAESAELFEFAQRRFDGLCAGDPFTQFEGEGLQEYYRCSLPEGPYLVVARFPRDAKASRWQVSIAIVNAG